MQQRKYTIFFRKLVLLVVILVAADWAMGKLLDHFYLRMKGGEAARTSYVMNTVTRDLLVFGSSRADHHYIPGILKDSLSFDGYNCGTDGQGILFHYCLLQSVMQRHVPRVVILDLQPGEFAVSTISYERLAHLLPYYERHREIRSTVDLRSPFERIKCFSSLYRFNSFPLTILVNNLVRRNEQVVDGYMPLQGKYDGPLATAEGAEWDGPVDSVKLRYFSLFLETAARKGCKVYVFVSPIFMKFTQTPVSIRLAKDTCAKYGAGFFDYSQSPRFLENEGLFYDNRHLNGEGAREYTVLVSGNIKNNTPD